MKLFKFIFKLIIFLIVLGCLLAGATLYLIYDPNVRSVNVEETIDINNIIPKSLANIKESENIEIHLSEDELNAILNGLRKDLNSQIGNSNVEFTSIFVETNSNELKLNAFFEAYGYKTSLKGKAIINLDDEKLEIKVSELSLGKIGLNDKDIKKIVSYVNLNSTSGVIEGVGIEYNIDKDELSISISMASVKNYILDSFDESSSGELCSSLFKMMFRIEDFISLYDGERKEIGVDLNLSSLKHGVSEKDTNRPYEIDIAKLNEDVSSLLNKSLNKSDSAALVKFLLKGYDGLENQEKSIVDTYDLSLIEVDKSAYTPLIPASTKEAEEIFISQIPTDFAQLTSFKGFKLSEEDFNDIFASQGLVGNAFTFPYIEKEVYKLSTIVIESLFVDILEDKFVVNVIVNVNGLPLVIALDFDSPESSGMRIISSLSEARVGKNNLNEEEITSFIKFVKEALKDIEWISVNDSSSEFVFDFTKMFDDSNELSQVTSYLTGIKTSFNSNEEDYLFIGVE